MTYFGFLAIFLGIPLILIGWLNWLDGQHKRRLPPELQNWSPATTIAAHIVVAVAYTTPWDNYLVATRVWWYDPTLVTGWVIGWVPIEEYTFFVLQTLLTGLWVVYLARRLPFDGPDDKPGLRRYSTWSAALLWLVMAAILWTGWPPGIYLALELVWALPPIMLQLSFGADILWRHRRVLFMGLVPTTVYLSLADCLAIYGGTWTIDPTQSLGIYLGGVLPIEELIFFGLTNTLVTFGLILVMARQSQARLMTAWRVMRGTVEL